MKKVTMLVDDDVEMIDIFSVRDEKIIPNVWGKGYINQKVLEVNVYKGENKSAFIEATYPAIPTDDKVENPNQKAIECLKEVKEHISKGLEYDYDVQIWIEEYIDNKIKELEG